MTTSPTPDDTLPNKRPQLASPSKHQLEGPEAAPPTPLTTTTSHNGNDSHSDADRAADVMDSDDDFLSNLSSEDDMVQEDDSDNDISNPEGKTIYPACRLQTCYLILTSEPARLRL